MAQEEHEMNEPYSSSRDGTNSTKDLIVSQVEDAKVITEWDASLYMTRYWPLLCLLGASFGAIHLISWVSVFPSEVELWLWRISALISVVTAVLFGSPFLYLVSRVVMAVETFAGLRAMEASTYEIVNISNYWFHFS
ncbi:hypothetical protein CEP53_010198 [Fusarium sp. AF-6]|nr:hypothetical protein CEP53_010198 [Fusarium sp. AF-6]